LLWNDRGWAAFETGAQRGEVRGEFSREGFDPADEIQEGGLGCARADGAAQLEEKLMEFAGVHALIYLFKSRQDVVSMIICDEGYCTR
jgi:hypothetical protein